MSYPSSCLIIENNKRNVGDMEHTELHRDPAKHSDNMETPEKEWEGVHIS